jgi:hypothetical protein
LFLDVLTLFGETNLKPICNVAGDCFLDANDQGFVVTVLPFHTLEIVSTSVHPDVALRHQLRYTFHIKTIFYIENNKNLKTKHDFQSRQRQHFFSFPYADFAIASISDRTLVFFLFSFFENVHQQ